MKFKLFENKIDLNDVEVYHEHTDSYQDQHNYTIFAVYNGILIGRCYIVLYDQELTVSYIEVQDDYRRMGVASKMMKYVQNDAEFEGFEYKSSNKTELGSKFKVK